jgi:hypothetical protein
VPCDEVPRIAGALAFGGAIVSDGSVVCHKAGAFGRKTATSKKSTAHIGEEWGSSDERGFNSLVFIRDNPFDPRQSAFFSFFSFFSS